MTHAMTTSSMLPVSRHTTHLRLVIFADLQSLVMKEGKQDYIRSVDVHEKESKRERIQFVLERFPGRLDRWASILNPEHVLCARPNSLLLTYKHIVSLQACAARSKYAESIKTLRHLNPDYGRQTHASTAGSLPNGIISCSLLGTAKHNAL